MDGNELPWVDSVKHLGHLLQRDNSMRLDIAKKRATFIAKTNALLQEFSNVSTEVFMKLLNSFATNLYGSNLWYLFGKDCEKLYTSYNVAIRMMLNVDRRTHRYLIEPLSDALHLKTLLASRFTTFHRSLITSPKLPVRFLARLYEQDLRTVHGKNLAEIAQTCSEQIELLTSSKVKDKLRYMSVPENESWRLGLCKELKLVRDSESSDLIGFSRDEVNAMLKFACAS